MNAVSEQAAVLRKQLCSNPQNIVAVHLEHIDSCAANCRRADQRRACRSKMPGPEIGSWIIEPRNLACFWIESRDVWPFEPIAVRASQREVFVDSLPSVFLGDDMVDLKWQRERELGNQTILAPLTGSPANGGEQISIH